MSLYLAPVSFRDACAFITDWHRHHMAPIGCKFCIGLADEKGVLSGVAIVGRPVARHLDDGRTLEVTRTAVADGVRHGNSMLYGAAWRASKALGYSRLISYTQTGESGVSLRAAGWQVIAERPARPGWDTPCRPRRPKGSENIARTLWEAV